MITFIVIWIFGLFEFLKSLAFYRRDIYPLGLRIFKSGDFIPRIGHFNLGIFIPGERGLKIQGFLSPGFFGNGNFSGIGIFFRWMEYPAKKPPLRRSRTKRNSRIPSDSVQVSSKNSTHIFLSFCTRRTFIT